MTPKNGKRRFGDLHTPILRAHQGVKWRVVLGNDKRSLPLLGILRAVPLEGHLPLRLELVIAQQDQLSGPLLSLRDGPDSLRLRPVLFEDVVVNEVLVAVSVDLIP